MAKKTYTTLINAAHASAPSGSATFIADDYSRISLAMTTVGGSCVCKYKITIYPTIDTPDSAAVTYADTTDSTAAAVTLFDNFADAQGVPYIFYKVKVDWESLASGNLVAAVAAQI